MGEVETIITDQTRAETRPATPWNVLLHDDPVNFMGYVTLVIRKIFGYPEARAEKHMLEVHQLGQSVVWSGARERAEMYVHQLHEHQLRATMEPAGGAE